MTIPAGVVSAVKRRSNGICEACADGRAEHIHHRKLRSQGGKHLVDNLLHACSECHRTIHDNPAESYDRGLLVHSWDEPDSVDVVPYYFERPDDAA